MSLPCIGYSGGVSPVEQTVLTTQDIFACLEICSEQREPEDTQFYLLVMDALNRIAGPNRLNITTALLQNLEPEDALNATEDALCATETISRSLTDTDPQKAKAYILAQLNNILCT